MRMTKKTRTPPGHVIVIRLTEEEKRAIERRAKKDGETEAPARWCREKLLAIANAS